MPLNRESAQVEARKVVKTAYHLFQPGQTLGGRYQVISCLGRGAMGVVYHVNQVFIDKEMALKTIENRDMSDQAMLRFQQEARTAFAVQHPNVIAVTDFGVLDDQTPFLVMELIRGETLSDRLKRTANLPVEQVIPMFIQICKGVEHAHGIGVIHRDLKPSNIMLLDDVAIGTEGSVKIVDFGIAKFAAENTEQQSLTRTGEVFGSPLYMSPEQCSGERVDNRSDIYSLGCVLFEALTGTPPFIGDNALSTMLKHQGENAPSLREASLGKRFPEALEQIVQRMLKKSPAERYQSLTDVANDLNATFRGDSRPAKVVSDTPSKTKERVKDKFSIAVSTFWSVAAAVSVLSALIAGLAAFLISQNQTPKLIPPKLTEQQKVIAKTVESALPLNDEIVSSAQVLPLKLLKVRLAYPDPIGHMSLNFKTITHECFVELSNARWITNLNIESTSFDNKDLAYLAKIPVKTLCMRASVLNDEGAEALKNCQNLDSVQAAGTSLTDDGVAKLCLHKKLTKLGLNETKVTDACIHSIGTLPILQTLELMDCDITGKYFNELSKCQIYCLDLCDTRIDDSALEPISKLPHLRKLTLNNTKVTMQGLQVLCTNKALQELYLSKCANISSEDLHRLEVKAPWMKIYDKPEKPTETSD